MCTLLGLEKRYMSLIIAYWIVVGLLLGTASVQAQPATVSGSVVLPAGINDKKRSFRGSQYRSRQTPSSRSKAPGMIIIVVPGHAINLIGSFSTIANIHQNIYTSRPRSEGENICIARKTADDHFVTDTAIKNTVQ